MEVTFNSIEEAVSSLKLDRRRKYKVWNNLLTYSCKYTHQCSGCYSGQGCTECGYSGKIVSYFPNPVTINDETMIKILTNPPKEK